MKQQGIKYLFLILAGAPFLFSQPVQSYSVPLDESASAGKRMIGVGRPGSIGVQFTDHDYEYIAKNHSIVMIEKFHAGGNMEKHHEAAAELKKRNPNIKVFPYLGTTYWFTIYKFGDHYNEVTKKWDLKDEWYLRDTEGNRIVQALDKDCVSTDDPRCTFYIDVRNAEYRNWAVNLVNSWMAETDGSGNPVYDGIHMDNAIILNVDWCYDNVNEEDCRKVNTLIEKLGGGDIGKAALKDYNEGIKSLIQELKQSLGEKQVIFNGVTYRPLNLGQSLEHFAYADMANDERFCFEDGSLIESREKFLVAINLIGSIGAASYPGKIFLEKANINTSIDGVVMTEEKKQQMRRLCYGAFLLGWRPGYAFYKEAEDGFYGVDGNVDIDPSEININFGDPIVMDSVSYRQTGNVYFRRFLNGRVYVNLEDTDQSVTVPDNFTLMNGGVIGNEVLRNSILTIPAKDAVFLILTDRFSCSNGTLYGQCAKTQPKFCENGKLVYRCAQCGCASGTCLSDGTCQDIDTSPPGIPTGLVMK